MSGLDVYVGERCVGEFADVESRDYFAAMMVEWVARGEVRP